MSILRNLAKIREAREKKIAEDRRIDLVAQSANSIDLTGKEKTTPPSNVPSHSETGLGLLDYEAVLEATNNEKKRGSYQAFSPAERYNIGKHASEHGTASTLRKFKNLFPNLKESTVRSIRKKCEEELKQSLKEKRDPNKSIATAPRGRPLLLGKIDSMVQDYLRVIFFLLMFIYYNESFFTATKF